jgi:hypothetical protein
VPQADFEYTSAATRTAAFCTCSRLTNVRCPLWTAGWVILIEEKSELARVLVALLVSIACIVLHFAIKPYRR